MMTWAHLEGKKRPELNVTGNVPHALVQQNTLCDEVNLSVRGVRIQISTR